MKGCGLSFPHPLVLQHFLVSENGVFGVPLSILIANDRKRDPMATIPLIFKEVRCRTLRLAAHVSHIMTPVGPDGQVS